MKYKSCCQWPAGTLDGYENDISTDTHESIEGAKAVIDLLRKNGFGGDGQIFPVKTWIETPTAGVVLYPL